LNSRESRFLKEAWLKEHIETCCRFLNEQGGVLHPFILIDIGEPQLIYMPVTLLSQEVRMHHWLRYASMCYPGAIGFCITSLGYLARIYDPKKYRYGDLQTRKGAQRVIQITILTKQRQEVKVWEIKQKDKQWELRFLFGEPLSRTGGKIKELAERLFRPPAGVV